VYLWIVPANAAGRWLWQLAGDGGALDCEITFDQTFQLLRGSARAAGRASRVESATLRGDEITIALLAEVNGTAVRYELSGRISGDTIRGVSRVATTRHETLWVATRVDRGSIDIDSAGMN
jgi:hypothetical protein